MFQVDVIMIQKLRWNTNFKTGMQILGLKKCKIFDKILTLIT